MRMLERRWWLAGFMLSVTVATLGLAQAQECGDPDRSGAVTVADGVNVLRQAAGLPSTCAASAAECDVDANGAVTVSDGVNVLRRAAGLSASLNCRSGNDVGRFAGAYAGTFSGDDRGTFDVEFDCDGNISGRAASSVFDEEFDVTGTITSNGDVTLAVGSTSSAATFTGTVGNDGHVSGQWNNRSEDLSGSFAGSRRNASTCSSAFARVP